VPIVKETLLLGVNDIKIAELLTDPPGGSPTYGPLIDIPGARTLKFTGNIVEKELKGDEQTLDTYQKLQHIEFSFENAKISLDALAVLEGGAVTASGTTPNQKQTHELLGSSLPGYFKMEMQAVYTDVGLGDVHVTLWKCKAKVDISFQSEDYAIVTVAGKAIPLASNNKIKTIEINETETAIA